MPPKKTRFIEIVPIDFKGSLGINPKEDYFLIPAQVAIALGYESTIISTNTLSLGKGNKISTGKCVGNEPITVVGSGQRTERVTLISLDRWIPYLRFLFKNNDAIIFANDRVAKSFMACFFGKYTIFMSHQSRLPPIWWQRLVFSFFIKRFDAIKVSNPFEKDELVKMGVKPERVHYIPLSIDHEFFEERPSVKMRMDAKKSLGIKKTDKVALFLAGIRHFKRVETVLKSVRLLMQQGRPIKLIVAGKDFLAMEGEKTVAEWIKELGIEGQVITTGNVSPEQVRTLMNISDVCINSSIHEGQCLVVYEAAAAGLPLCVSSIGSFTSVFTDSALFHEPENPETLAKNILYYLEHPALAKKHVAINKKIVKERCDYAVVKRKLAGLFSKNTL